MLILFLYFSWFAMPILGIVFCLNLVTILRKIKEEKPTRKNTFWLTFSFVLIIWTIAMVSTIGVY